MEVLAENVGRLLGDSFARSRLLQLPLVWCGDEVFDRASNVYFDSPDIIAVLGKDVLIARFPGEQKEAIRDLYRWLGVSEEPRPGAIIDRIRSITSSEPKPSNIQIIQKIFSFLATKWIYWDEAKHQEFSELKRMAWLPSENQTKLWFTPDKVFTAYQNYLFISQGNFLRIDVPTQRKANDLMNFLGNPTEPPIELVIRHLLHCSEQDQPANQEIYTFLTRYSADSLISQLLEKPCLLLRLENGKEKYFRPDQVFWEQHPFGRFRLRLGPEFGKFKPLYDRLRVKPKPDAQDAINVLSEISESSYVVSTKPIDSDGDSQVELVIVACWQLLTDCLDRNDITPKELKKKLQGKKTIPKENKVLDVPEHLFFEDRPGWGEKFELIQNNLIPRINGAWPAMEAAGVRRVSKAITTEMQDPENSRIDTKLTELLTERLHLIQRVMELHTSKGIKGFDLPALIKLRFESAESIKIARTFHGLGTGQSVSTINLEVDAICIGDIFYFHGDEQDYPWFDIARELAYVLYPEGDLNSLGMEIKDILSSPSVEVANRNLDILGYPRLKIVNKTTEDTGTQTTPGGSAGGTNGTGSSGTSKGTSADGNETVGAGTGVGDAGSGDAGKDGTRTGDAVTGTGNTGTTGGSAKGDTDAGGAGTDGTGTETTPESSLPPRKTSHLISYLYSEDDIRTKQPDTEENTRRRIELGNLGVLKVITYEKLKERTPTEMPYGNPGYDIQSVGKNGSIRYIEVKALTNQWDSQSPAQMTHTEFELAKELGPSYWLYVVELVERDDFKIYRIQNPANQVEYFLFDHGWLSLVQKDE